MSKNCKRLKIYHQKITPQGRKKWRRITRRQQEWMLKALRYLYAEVVTATHKPLKSAKRKIIIDTLFEKLRERRVFISKGEVSRIADDKMRKWNKNMMKGEQKERKFFLAGSMMWQKNKDLYHVGKGVQIIHNPLDAFFDFWKEESE